MPSTPADQARPFAGRPRLSPSGLVGAAFVLVLRKAGVVSERFARIGLIVCRRSRSSSSPSLPTPARCRAARAPSPSTGSTASPTASRARSRSASCRVPSGRPSCSPPSTTRSRTPTRSTRVGPCRCAFRANGRSCSLMLRASRRSPSFEIRKHQPVYTAKTIDAVDVTADDLDAMREFLREIDQQHADRRGEGRDPGVQPAHRGHREQAARSHRGLPQDGGSSSASC